MRQATSPQLTDALRAHLRADHGRRVDTATPSELYDALVAALRGEIMDRWVATGERYAKPDVRRVCYLSMEFLLGRLLRSAVQALGLEGPVQEALEQIGATLEDMEEEENASALGSGGLGRLAACFLDSMATHDYPAYGYGLRYEFGLFRQRIVDGWQTEQPDDWLRWGNPWEVRRPDEAVQVQFFGYVDANQDEHGQFHFDWTGSETVLAVPYDMPVCGFRTDTVNTLRLWEARPLDSGVDLDVFHSGDFLGASAGLVQAETITKVLYPAERTEAGQLLRLKQQYFLASATLQDLVRRHLLVCPDLSNFHERVAIQLNDTHPAIAIPELMRLLLDAHDYSWDDAWEITRKTFAYTNHTLLPEALETWSYGQISNLLPRHMQIVQEIDRRFSDHVRQWRPNDEDVLSRMAIVSHDAERRVRMANLSVVASSSVNGVAALHTELLREGVLKDFAELFPERFNNKTNGITPRRWIHQANPQLSALISEHLGEAWIKDLDQLRQLEPAIETPEFRARFREIKRANKVTLSNYVKRTQGVVFDPDSLFDVQIKRIHEYKRQLLLALYTVDHYLRIRADPNGDFAPRTVIVAGKAAADYDTAKLVIRLFTSLQETINADKLVRGRLQVAFLENYRVSLAQPIVTAADLSEQISTAGYEASGTGNMKFALNGALTIGTLDGANVEIREAVDPDHFFLFGLTADQVAALRHEGYRPRGIYEQSERVREVLDALSGPLFSRQPGLFHPLVDALLDRDHYLVLADFGSYCRAQEQVEALWR
ncbi:MAG: glycogen/starch/alpha-glucan phosphorylase, partial [Planctomycetes bacterium]|nr:glycogen/starch/alpha-glucan phosphorylase [Planctomycetota bacterium]